MPSSQYVIFCGTGAADQQCIGVNASNDCIIVSYDPTSTATNWVLMPIPGTPYSYLQHADTGLCAQFGNPQAIKIKKFNAFDIYQPVSLDNHENGLISIYNPASNKVMDSAGQGPGVGQYVQEWDWSGNQNQKWIFVSLDLLNNPEIETVRESVAA